MLLTGCAWGQNGTLMDSLHHLRFTTLISFIQVAGLTDTLNGRGPFTLFAPNNHAFIGLKRDVFNRMKSDPSFLTAIFKYHIVNGSSISSTDLQVNEKMIPSMEGRSIRLNHFLHNGHSLVGGVRLYNSGHNATNGVIHEIGGVMVPPVGSVVDVINNDPELSTLKLVVQSAGLTMFLQDQNPITMFAPTNRAFQDRGDSFVQGLIKQPALLSTLLKYHMIPGSLWADGFHQQMLETFDANDKLRLHRFYFLDYEVDNAPIEMMDISATNGVVHKIGGVLIPSSIRDQVTSL
ncbi:transforming growth factor-beta-induced protein ig-h3-like [Gigantopelta aegis]|uniref:transforming growth factor-beta-induced protein ig-h3-like n=1 Tax=Gigantopelta aegis TaxID=1735272 RepID=UPI001B88ABB4|nr:transforming growth factor-beta-induced protein ig-h3-like [Gigantopelta aegis]